MPGKVFLMPEEWPPAQQASALAKYTLDGTIVEGCKLEDFETWSARGRVDGCDCDMIICVCAIARTHVKECIYRRVILSPIGIECEDHGMEDCGVCTPCTCPTTPP